VRVLVTGGCGFLGSHVCEAFLRRGDEVVSLDNMTKFELDRTGYQGAAAREHNWKLLEGQGAQVSYHDPYVKSFTEEGHARTSIALTADAVAAADCVMVVTDHQGVDYALIKQHARSVVDTRNVLARVG